MTWYDFKTCTNLTRIEFELEISRERHAGGYALYFEMWGTRYLMSADFNGGNKFTQSLNWDAPTEVIVASDIRDSNWMTPRDQHVANPYLMPVWTDDFKSALSNAVIYTDRQDKWIPQSLVMTFWHIAKFTEKTYRTQSVVLHPNNAFHPAHNQNAAGREADSLNLLGFGFDRNIPEFMTTAVV